MLPRIAGFLLALTLAGALPGQADSTGSDPRDFASLGDLALFSADDGVNGQELWRTDGTAAGTFRLTDICPGDCGGWPFLAAKTPDRVWFVASEDAHQTSHILIVARGAEPEIVQLTGPLRDVVFPGLVDSRGIFYFGADDGIHGLEPWRSDGTPEGTFMVRDIAPGPEGSFLTYADEPVEFRGRIFFAARDSVRGDSLWVTDGTEEGTRLLRDPVPGTADHFEPRLLTATPSRLFFFAPAPNTQGDLVLWTSDGTTRGTVTVPIPGLPRGRGLLVHEDGVAVIGDRFYFFANAGKGYEAWVAEGTTVRVLTRFAPRWIFGEEGFPFGVQVLGQRLVFSADDDVHGLEPWITDGTPAGTRLLRDVCGGKCSSGALPIAVVQGDLYLGARDNRHGRELWITNGTSAGTRLVRDLCSGTCNFRPINGRALGDLLLFTRGLGDRTLWRSDGTSEGTFELTPGHHNPTFFEAVAVPGGVLFRGNEPEHGLEPWITDGTLEGTRLLLDIK